MPADRGTTALVAARFRAGAVLAASITQCWQHCLQLVGTKDNPVRDPAKRPPTGKGSIGDTMFKDGLAIVIAAWVALIAIYMSLRNHNV
jgi:hypothetical protein